MYKNVQAKIKRARKRPRLAGLSDYPEIIENCRLGKDSRFSLCGKSVESTYVLHYDIKSGEGVKKVGFRKQLPKYSIPNTATWRRCWLMGTKLTSLKSDKDFITKLKIRVKYQCKILLKHSSAYLILVLNQAT